VISLLLDYKRGIWSTHNWWFFCDSVDLY